MSARAFLDQPTSSSSQPQSWSRRIGQTFYRATALSLAVLLLPVATPELFAQQAPPPPGYTQYPQTAPQDTPPPPPDQYDAPPQQPYPQQYPQQQYPQQQYAPQQPSPQPHPYDQQYAPQYPQQQQPYPDQQQQYAPQYQQQQPYADQQQYAQPYPQQTQPAMSLDQIEQLVAPIALYPDSLLAQVLAASTYPTQVAEADRWRQSMGYAPPDAIAAQANMQPWDASIKALTAFPDVLGQMDQNLSWTTELGNAYFNQPQDVTNAIQDLRQRAQASGNLENTPQEQVTDAQGAIDIAPANPQVVYVPAYNPWAVYGAPIAPWPGFSLFDALAGIGPAFAGPWFGGVRFGLGVVLAAFSHMPWGFFGWGLDWGGHSLLFQHQGWYSHSRTLVDWGLPHGGPRYWAGRGTMMAGRGGYYGRPGYGGRSVYDSRLNSRYTPRSFNPGNSAEGFRRYGAAHQARSAQAFNRAPAFNARPGYNLPSRSFAPSHSLGYDNRTIQSYNRGQNMNSFRSENSFRGENNFRGESAPDFAGSAAARRQPHVSSDDEDVAPPL